MRTLALGSLALALAVLGMACGDDGNTLVQYEPSQKIEKVNCAGGEACAECCNDGFCAVGQSCQDGSGEDGRVIFFCDGPEDCAAPKMCCIKGTQAGAIVGSCSDTCDSGLKACHVPVHCDGAACGAFEEAPYIGVCDDGNQEN